MVKVQTYRMLVVSTVDTTLFQLIGVDPLLDTTASLSSLLVDPFSVFWVRDMIFIP